MNIVDHIPTYIINLKNRPDRLENCLSQFGDRDEFKIIVIEPIFDHQPVISLWKTIKQIVLNACLNQDPFILICEDDHVFTPSYNWQNLMETIMEVDKLEGDVVAGGVSSFLGGIQVSDKLFWMERFSGTQFIIIFSRFFSRLIAAEFNVSDTADYKIAALSKKKYTIFPFISTQKSFGYSDVTPRNNSVVNVESLFRDTEFNLRVLKDVANFYKTRNEYLKSFPPIEFSTNFSIPTYIINLVERIDRREHIVAQFKDRPEFDTCIIEACKNEIGAVGLWLSFRKIIQMAVDNDEDVIIICEDDHCFTDSYSKEYLFVNILEAHRQDVEYVSGGTSYYNFAIPVSSNRFWVDTCLATQFVVLFKNSFKLILNETFDDTVVADVLLSHLLKNKMILYPSISKQKDFGYSDVSSIHNANIGLVDSMFEESRRKLENLKQVISVHGFFESLKCR